MMLNKIRTRRIYYILILMSIVAMAIGLLLYSLKQNINLFLTPTQALAQHLPLHYTFRLGGQVKPESIRREKNSLTMHFILQDAQHALLVTYTGILPDLFRAGNGAIAEGKWNDGRQEFIATQILAKHDEKYMPRAVYENGKKGNSLD